MTPGFLHHIPLLLVISAKNSDSAFFAARSGIAPYNHINAIKMQRLPRSLP